MTSASGSGRSRPLRALPGAGELPLGGCSCVGQVALVDLYPDLLGSLNADERHAVRDALRVPLVRVQSGRCELGACAGAAGLRGPILGALVTDGLVIGETRLAGQIAAQIYGPGDLLNAERERSGWLATVHTLVAPAPVTLAVLDDHFLAAIRRWPRMAGRFLTQAMRQADRADDHQAISQLNRVEDRLLAVFWHLADRWGRPSGDAVVIDLPLTHETIGRLIGARRPTVTLGLGELARKGVLQRQAGGTWLLHPGVQPRATHVPAA